jgi:hypothetical protein
VRSYSPAFPTVTFKVYDESLKNLACPLSSGQTTGSPADCTFYRLRYSRVVWAIAETPICNDRDLRSSGAGTRGFTVRVWKTVCRTQVASLIHEATTCFRHLSRQRWSEELTMQRSNVPLSPGGHATFTQSSDLIGLLSVDRATSSTLWSPVPELFRQQSASNHKQVGKSATHLLLR